MITEDYCSLEVARKLKEKGFPYSLLGNYYLKSVINEDYSVENTFTHAIAMKWLREKGYHITIDLSFKANYNSEKPFANTTFYIYEIIATESGVLIYDDESEYDTYEEAVEAALKYTLKNILQ